MSTHMIYLEGGVLKKKMRSYFQGGVGQLQSKCVQGGRGVKKGPKIAFIIKVRFLFTYSTLRRDCLEQEM